MKILTLHKKAAYPGDANMSARLGRCKRSWPAAASVGLAASLFGGCFPSFDTGQGGRTATSQAATTEGSTAAQTADASTSALSSVDATGATSSTGIPASAPGSTGGRTQHSLGPMTTYDMTQGPQTTIQPGDMALVTLFYDDSTAFISAPPDWTLVGSSDIGAQSALQWYVHRLVASDGSTFTFTSNKAVSWRSSISAFANVTGVKMVNGDATPAEPLDVSEGPVGTYTLPSITTAVANTLLYCTGTFPTDEGFVNWSSPTLHLEGFGDGILILDELAVAPGVVASPTVTTPNGGKGPMLVNTFVLTP